MFKNVASQSIALFAFDTTTGLPKTGDAANMLFYLSKDWGTVTVLAGNSGVPTEMDATNAKGWYKIAVSQTESNFDAGLFSGKSSTANIQLVGVLIQSVPVNFTTFVIDSSGNGAADVKKLLGTAWLTPGTAGTPDVNTKLLGGTSQTGRDIGASVLLSAGSGTGQLDFTSGVVKSNLAQILGTALTETAGLLAGGFKKFFNIASPAATMDHGVLVDTVTTATTATNLTNAPTAGDFTATMKTSIGTAMAASAVASVTGSVGSIATGGIASTSFAAGAIDAASIATDAIGSAEFSAAASNKIADALLDRTAGVETGITPRQGLRVILGASAGKLSGAATTTVAIRDTNDTVDRISATVDSNGNRSAVTLNLT